MEELKKFVETEMEMWLREDRGWENRMKGCSYCLGAVQYAMTIGQVTYDEVEDWWEGIRARFYNEERSE